MLKNYTKNNLYLTASWSDVTKYKINAFWPHMYKNKKKTQK